MCYYNGVKVTHGEFIRLKQLEKLIAQYDFLVKPLEIGFDYGQYPVLKKIEGHADFEIVKMEWGFIPHYITNRQDLDHFRKGGVNPKTGKYDVPILTLNAIGEEMFEKTTYKKSALHRRCLVLSSGFYEWRHVFPANKRTGAPVKTAIKYPYFITLPGKEYFFMAGIWTPWTDRATGEYVESFAIVTTKANALMEQVHNSKKRMPCILPEELAYEWLMGDLDEARVIEIASTQYPAAEMQAHPIAKDFTTALDPQAAFEYVDLPPLAAV